jgi:hypothetical protein
LHIPNPSKTDVRASQLLFPHSVWHRVLKTDLLCRTVIFIDVPSSPTLDGVTLIAKHDFLSCQQRYAFRMKQCLTSRDKTSGRTSLMLYRGGVCGIAF